jgi:hypothetical protein
MKKFIAFRILVITLITVIGITSCSKDDETNKSVTQNAKVSTYLKSFYTKNYQLGKSVDTKIVKETSVLSKSTDVDNLVITEVFVGDDTRARGYVITDKSTDAFLYFIDVDRIDYKLTTVKIDVNETKVFNNIEDLDKYTSTNEFDLIKIAEQVNSGILQGNKFWGSGGWHNVGGCDEGWQTISCSHYMFWIVVDVEYNEVRC